MVDNGWDLAVVRHRSWGRLFGILKVVDARWLMKEVLNDALRFLLGKSALGTWVGLHEGRLTGGEEIREKLKS